jgi:hypothetical protein
MEEKYWNQFMATGSVTDYLNYRGIAICSEVMKRYGQEPKAGTGEGTSEPDNGNGNGFIGYSHGGI